MKQGDATSSRVGATKPEGTAQLVNPGGVAQIGKALGQMSAVQPVMTGRGVQAPMPKSETCHHCGSQGKR